VSDPGRQRYLRAVSELAGAPKLIDQLRAVHVKGDDGFCTAPVCGRPGHGTPCLPWPCPTRRLADLAWAAARRRDPGPRS
jgi:hypothetical protein